MFNATDHTCPIDWQDLFKRIPDESIIEEFAISFVKNSDKLMLTLRQVVADGDPEQIELYAHAMKGSASNIGAICLAKAAWQLEKSAAEKQLTHAAANLDAIDTAFRDVTDLLGQPDWIRQAQAAPTR